MKHFYVQPEPSGEIGVNTILDMSVHPPQIVKFHWEVSIWPEDAIIENYPEYLLTRQARDLLKLASATGVDFDDVEVTRADQLDLLHTGRQLPKFCWLKVHGVAGVDDFGIAANLTLVVSERALDILRQLGIENALVEPFPQP